MIKDSKLDILKSIYSQLIFNENDCNIKYRIVLLEPDKSGILKAALFYTFDRKAPKILLKGEGFKIEEGVAGWAWYYKAAFFIPDVAQYIN